MRSYIGAYTVSNIFVLIGESERCSKRTEPWLYLCGVSKISNLYFYQVNLKTTF